MLLPFHFYISSRDVYIQLLLGHRNPYKAYVEELNKIQHPPCSRLYISCPARCCIFYNDGNFSSHHKEYFPQSTHARKYNAFSKSHAGRGAYFHVASQAPNDPD